MILLNMIVRNEAQRLERAIASVAGVADAMAILDTGSTDGTQALLVGLAMKYNMRLCMEESPFVDFSTSRNQALRLAGECLSKEGPLSGHYILLMDADMELRDWPKFGLIHTAPSYRILQRHDGGLSYWNTRLIRADVDACYRGATHEYLEIPDGAGPPAPLEGPWFFDHSDGANRTGKFARDIALLEGDLDNPRSVFYLAQSHRDAWGAAEGEVAKAIADTAQGLPIPDIEVLRTKAAYHKNSALGFYDKRSSMGAWEEEAWQAQLEAARLDPTAERLLATFNRRPQRAEPLQDLCRGLRERGFPNAAVPLAAHGMTLKRPEGDTLFVDEATYQWGMRQEFSIAANYSPEPLVKNLGALVCDGLTLDREAPEGVRSLAFANFHFYMQSAQAMFPSWTMTPVNFVPPPGLAPMSPSIIRWRNGYAMVLRVVNYVAEADGKHSFCSPDGIIKTRNWLLTLDKDFETTGATELKLPLDWPPINYELVRGIEDMRLARWGQELWIIGNTRELAEGWCQQLRAKIGPNGQLTEWKIISKVPPERHEKNWMPFADINHGYLYLHDPTTLLNFDGATVSEFIPAIWAEGFRGSSQLILFDGGWYLGIIHEVEWRGGLSYYRSRFVEYDLNMTIRRVSLPFYCRHHGLEIATGICYGNNKLVLSFGLRDREAWIGTMDWIDLEAALHPVG